MSNLSNREANNFDFVRFVAALMVVITHSYALLGLGEDDLLSKMTGGALQFSHLGVAIFFTISGYLITQSALTSKTFKAYLWRRCLRIFPGLAVVLLLCAFLLGPLFTSLSTLDYLSNKGTYQFLGSISLFKLQLSLPGMFEENPLPNAVNGSLWTLAYEFSLYIVVFMFLRLKLLEKKITILVLWTFMLLIRLYLGNKYFIYNYSTPYLLGLNIMYLFEWSLFFMAGMLFYLYRIYIKMHLAGLTVLIICYIISLHFGVARFTNYLLIPYAVFFFSLSKGKLNSFGKYGDFSYGLYVYAFPVQQLIVHIANGNVAPELLMFLTVLGTLPFAVLSWKLIEQKALEFKYLVK